MKKTVSINDIANHLQLSRNTVSKALNGRYVPERTRKLVLAAAIEMGYKSYELVHTEGRLKTYHKILLLSSRTLLNINFYVYIIRAIESALEENNIELIQQTVKPSFTSDFLDSYIKQMEIDGIICLELFDSTFINYIINLNIPSIFLDFTYDSFNRKGNFDILMMENFEAVKEVCLKLISKYNLSNIGFVGDYKHCRSFYERFLGLREAMFLKGLEFDMSSCITFEDSFPYGDSNELLKVLKDFKKLPDCFVCANDYIALSLIHALKKINIKVPEEIKIIGFDNVYESKVSSPPLSTVNVDKQALGKKVLSILLGRINDPQQKSRIIYLKSAFVERQTT